MPDQNYKLAMFEQGQGKPLVLLHGLISTHRYWHQIIGLIDTTKWRVITPDLLGFGDSPKPKDAQYNLTEQVSSTAQAITPYLENPSVVVGHSMGAIIALKLAVDKPELFSKLILSALPLLRPETKYRQLASITDSRLVRRERAAKLAVHGLGLVNRLPERLMTIQKKWPKHIGEDWTKHGHQAYQQTIKSAQYIDAMLDLLSKLTVPTTLLVGKYDGMIGEQGVEGLNRVAACNNNLTIQLIEAKHNLPIEHPEIVAKAILQA